MGNVNKMPQSWIQTTLGDISLINPKLDLVDFSDDLEISFIPMAAVKTESGQVDLTQTRKLGSVKKGYTPFIDGDVIFAKITPCMENGKIAFLSGLKEGIGFGSTEFHVSRPLNDIPRKFIFYFLVQRSYRKDAQGNMTGSAGQLRVSTIFFRDSRIPLPPLREQHRIVAKIEELFGELDKGVEALKTAQQQLKVYRQAVLKWAFEGKLTEEWRKQQKNLPAASQLLEQIKTEKEKHAHTTEKKLKPIAPLTQLELSELPSLPHGWCWTRLGDLANLITKGASPKWQGFNYVSDVSQLLFITSENVRQCYLNISEPKYLEIAFSSIQKRSELKFGDILFNIVGASIGRAAIFNLGVKANINQAVCLIRLSEIVLNFYLVNYLNSVQLKKYYENRVVDVARANLSLDDVSKFPIPFCTIQEQNQIVQEIETRLSVADKLEGTITQSLQQAEALRQSILKKAFAGKLVPQDPSDEPASKLLERIKAEKAALSPVVKKSKINRT
jgi:type I restriction enzyme S subunit